MMLTLTTFYPIVALIKKLISVVNLQLHWVGFIVEGVAKP